MEGRLYKRNLRLKWDEKDSLNVEGQSPVTFDAKISRESRFTGVHQPIYSDPGQNFH